MKYVHTNIIAKDWKALSAFYQDVFDCEIVPPERHQGGEWLERGTGVRHAELEGVHLLLPGYGNRGPTLEIYTYASVVEHPVGPANRTGFGHLAFEVDDVRQTLEKLLKAGGELEGQLASNEIEGVGVVTFVYARDPEGNLLELQSWRKTAEPDTAQDGFGGRGT